jgi:hypothetical protein
MTIELSENIEALFDKNLTWESYTLMGVKLKDKVDNIPLSKIKNTTMERYPDGVKSLTLIDGKVFYDKAGQRQEYLLADRIKSVFESNGWIHLIGGASFRIKEGKVVEFRIDEDLLLNVKYIPFNKIEKRFGKADKKIIWDEPVDKLYTTTTFIYISSIYISRQLRVTYEDYDKTINGINIGETLLEEYNIETTANSTLPKAGRTWLQKLLGN